MSEVKNEQVDKTPLDYKKIAHDYYATAVEVLTTRIRYLPEEFEAIHQLITFLKQCKSEILADIHKEEPPVIEEKATNVYDMDLKHVKPVAQDAIEVN